MNEIPNNIETEEQLELELTFTLTVDDVYIFHKDHLNANKLSYGIPVIIAVAVTVFILYRLEYLFDIHIFFRLSLLALLNTGTFYLYFKLLKIGAKKQYAQDIELQQQANFKIYQDKFIYTSEMSSSTRKFEELYKITESKNLFLLYITGHKALILPKRMFNSWEDINKMREILSYAKTPIATAKKEQELKRAIFIIVIVFVISLFAWVIFSHLLFGGYDELYDLKNLIFPAKQL